MDVEEISTESGKIKSVLNSLILGRLTVSKLFQTCLSKGLESYHESRNDLSRRLDHNDSVH